ncbi:hypothetical protein JVT61DRAFT_784 [Boletus reticuloceps]|uniref:Uncharacterized protein n=1 Tax=Boletus reticuloceps TaxID=495285 RepID=A0A8I3AE05_9AGAM|nr:hypothetical protein JVT61DRAFT_784 [Boletus reticuloceps]
MFEMKASMVEYHSRYMHIVEDSAMSGSAARLPEAISRGYAVLVDATGREHTILLDHCRYLGQLDAMLSVILFECRPDEAEIQRWYIERKLYDFVIYNKTNSDVIQLTRESDIWSNMESGTRIVVRVIVEEVVRSAVMATYKCPCGTLNAVEVSIEEVATALQRGCTIIWALNELKSRHCERRFQITRTQNEQEVTDDTSSQRQAIATPAAESKHLIRNFLARQVVPRLTGGYHRYSDLG